MASPERRWTIRELLATTREWFAARGLDSPRLDAEVLLAHALALPRIKLYTDFERPLERAEVDRYRALVKRRAAGEPVQYLVGEREFYGRAFKTDPRALIPRPETELVVERVLRDVPAQAPARLLDVGCGCGAIGLTLAAERPAASVVLVDVSEEAAALARENAERLGVAARVDIRTGDLLAPVQGETFDAVAANLPYIPQGARAGLAVHIREHEPALALFSGADGLDLLRRFVPAAAACLRSGGRLVVEHGEEQARAVCDLFAPAAWEPATSEKDLAGLDRFVHARRR